MFSVQEYVLYLTQTFLCFRKMYIYTYGRSELLPSKCISTSFILPRSHFKEEQVCKELFPRTCYRELPQKKRNRWFPVSRQFITEDLQVRAEKPSSTDTYPSHQNIVCVFVICMDFTFITIWEETVIFSIFCIGAVYGLFYFKSDTYFKRNKSAYRQTPAAAAFALSPSFWYTSSGVKLDFTFLRDDFKII